MLRAHQCPWCESRQIPWSCSQCESLPLGDQATLPPEAASNLLPRDCPKFKHATTLKDQFRTSGRRSTGLSCWRRNVFQTQPSKGHKPLPEAHRTSTVSPYDTARKTTSSISDMLSVLQTDKVSIASCSHPKTNDSHKQSRRFKQSFERIVSSRSYHHAQHQTL